MKRKRNYQNGSNSNPATAITQTKLSPQLHQGSMPKSTANPVPTIQEWKDLYSMAIEFQRLECWNYFWDTDIFGVKNPETGEIGYCCIMGKEGEHFALAVYRGTSGLEGLTKVFNGEVVGTTIDTLHVQNCIMVSFEDRNYLDKKDIGIINKLQLEFRGRNAWPQFRDYTPGYLPWYLNGKDARFLMIALKQAMEMLERIRKDPEMLFPQNDTHFLVRIWSEGKDGASWTDKWLEPIYEDIAFESLDSLKIQERLDIIMKAKKTRAGTWEIGTFYSQSPVRKGQEKPYYPKMVLYVDQHTGLILSYFMSKPVKYQMDFVNNFISFLEENRILPNRIVASNYEILELLNPITEKLEIGLFTSDFLEAVETARTGMDDFIVDSSVSRKKRKTQRRN